MDHPAANHVPSRWPVKSSRPSGRFPIFSLRTDTKTSPRTGVDQDFYVIECSDWVNVIALTPDRRMITVRQYRHGTETIELEVPGGAIDAQEDNSPLEAGIRELREETGYEGRRARIIGGVYPNPAIMNNTCWTVLVEDCERKHPLSLDQGEDIATELISLDEIRQAVIEGRICHALIIVALRFFEIYQTENLHPGKQPKGQIVRTETGMSPS